MTGWSLELLPTWHLCVLEGPPPGQAITLFTCGPETPLSGCECSLEGTPCLPACLWGGPFLWHLCGAHGPGRHPSRGKPQGEFLSPSGLLWALCVPFPHIQALCGLRGGWRPAPSLFLLPLLWACQECREIRGRGHRKCLLPSKDSSSCKWRELGEGQACGKLSPRQGKPAHPSLADRRALSP